MIDETIHPSPSTREVLLEAALACFAKYGYDATSIRLIGSLAGKNSSLIAYYFESKEGLYREVFKFLFTRFPTEPIAPWTPGPSQGLTQGARALLRLRELIRTLLYGVDAHIRSVDPLKDSAIRVFLSEIHSPREEVRDLLQEKMRPLVQELRQCLLAMEPGLSPADCDFWGITIQGCCIGHALRSEVNRMVWTSVDPSLSLEAMAERLTQFVHAGLIHGCSPALTPAL